jgi:hypothetical protein
VRTCLKIALHRLLTRGYRLGFRNNFIDVFWRHNHNAVPVTNDDIARVNGDHPQLDRAVETLLNNAATSGDRYHASRHHSEAHLFTSIDIANGAVYYDSIDSPHLSCASKDLAPAIVIHVSVIVDDNDRTGLRRSNSLDTEVGARSPLAQGSDEDCHGFADDPRLGI